ncbi:MAG TPA: hypothetical protein VGH93_03210 [Solirubrobacteraceae bacterium]
MRTCATSRAVLDESAEVVRYSPARQAHITGVRARIEQGVDGGIASALRLVLATPTNMVQ